MFNFLCKLFNFDHDNNIDTCEENAGLSIMTEAMDTNEKRKRAKVGLSDLSLDEIEDMDITELLDVLEDEGMDLDDYEE